MATAQETGYDSQFYEDETRRYYAHGLPAWRWFVLEKLKATSIMDLGGGTGGWLEPLVGDISVKVVDWLEEDSLKYLRVHRSSFVNADLRMLRPEDVSEHRDVTMSLECMEHLANVHEANFLDCLLAPKPRLVVLSCGSGEGVYDPTQFRVNRLGERVLGGPNWKAQFGRHHVNCQPVEVVIDKMSKRGYEVDQDLSSMFSSLRVSAKRSGTRWAFAGFYRRNTRVYRRASNP